MKITTVAITNKDVEVLESAKGLLKSNINYLDGRDIEKTIESFDRIINDFNQELKGE